MPTELSLAIQQICEEKNLSLTAVKETIEAALASAFRKDFGNKLQNLKVNFDLDSGAFEIFDVKEVVTDELKAEYDKLKAELEAAKEAGLELPSREKPEVKEEVAEGSEEEEKKFNPKTMMALAEAQALDKKHQLGDEIITKLEVPAEFGRMAAQTAKQVIIQRLREAERDIIFNEYKDKQGELINGTIQRWEGKVVPLIN